MAFTGVELGYPPPKGEISIKHLARRPVPSGYRQLVYIVHPSTVEGDQARVVQTPVQALIDAQPIDSRVILVAPPQKCVYLRPGSIVTDIRSAQFYLDWASQQDYPDDVENVILAGGNLERCLSAVVASIKNGLSLLVESGNLKRDTLNVTIPLDAIYTVSGLSADLVLSRLMQEANPLEAIVSLLTIAQPNNRGHYGEFEIVSSIGVGRYVLNLNGNNIGSLTPKKGGSPYIEPHSEIEQGQNRWPRIILPPFPELTYNLNITTGNPQTSPSDQQIGNITERLRHVRNVVLPKYSIERNK